MYIYNTLFLWMKQFEIFEVNVSDEFLGSIAQSNVKLKCMYYTYYTNNMIFVTKYHPSKHIFY